MCNDIKFLRTEIDNERYSMINFEARINKLKKQITYGY